MEVLHLGELVTYLKLRQLDRRRWGFEGVVVKSISDCQVAGFVKLTSALGLCVHSVGPAVCDGGLLELGVSERPCGFWERGGRLVFPPGPEPVT